MERTGTMYKIIYFFTNHSKKGLEIYEDTVSESELDLIRSNVDVCIISQTKLD